jgi:hypothetical protein
VTPVENSDESEDNEQMVNVAVLGYGTVGSGVVEVINTNHDSINKKPETRSISSMYLIFAISREILLRRFLSMISTRS